MSMHDGSRKSGQTEGTHPLQAFFEAGETTMSETLSLNGCIEEAVAEYAYLLPNMDSATEEERDVMASDAAEAFVDLFFEPWVDVARDEAFCIFQCAVFDALAESWESRQTQNRTADLMAHVYRRFEEELPGRVEAFIESMAEDAGVSGADYDAFFRANHARVTLAIVDELKAECLQAAADELSGLE